MYNALFPYSDRYFQVHVLLFNDMLLIAKREGTLLVALEPPLNLTCIMVQDFTSVDREYSTTLKRWSLNCKSTLFLYLATEFCITVIKVSMLV